MKNLKLIALLFAAILFTFSACKDDDDDEPQGQPIEILSMEISPDNVTVVITFNQGVYKNADMTGNVDAASFQITFVGQNPVSATYTAQHTAGEDEVTITITYENRLDGDEFLELTVLANTIFGAEGNALTQNLEESMVVNKLGVIGKWSAYDISFILQSAGFDDSLYAEFYADESYLVTAYQGGIPITFEGVYQMAETQFDGIWEIVLNQTAVGGQPSEVTSEGIFKVYPAAQDSMWYEVAQVDPAIPGVTPPTADQGFGSTSGGAFGTGNIQKYYWIGQ
jgi:hypothetical protein